MAEKDYSVSPYAFCGGDPVNYADKLGLTGTKTGSGDGWMTGELDEWEVTPDGARINSSGSGSNMTSPGSSFRAWQAQREREQAENQSMNKESEYQRMQRLMAQQGIVKGDKSETKEIGRGIVLSVLNGTAAFGAGVTVDMGMVKDATGNAKIYLTLGGVQGIGATAGCGIALTNKDFHVGDIGGEGASVNVSIFGAVGFDAFGDAHVYSGMKGISGHGLPGENMRGAGVTMGVGTGYFVANTYTYLAPIPQINNPTIFFSTMH